MLLDRVSDAQRIATKELREMQANDPKAGHRKRKGRGAEEGEGGESAGNSSGVARGSADGTGGKKAKKAHGSGSGGGGGGGGKGHHHNKR